MRYLTLLLATILILAAPSPAQAPLISPPPLWQPKPVPERMETKDPRVELLARLIHAEAQGECFRGQVAVGAVVMNRVRDPRWPDTIREVIRQPGQFAQPSRSAGDMARRAAQAALAGEDPTGGAVFFYNPRLATDTWIFSRPVVCEIGRHRFAK